MNDPLPRLKTISSLFSNILSTILLNKKSWCIKIKNDNSGLHFSTIGLALIEKSPNTNFFSGPNFPVFSPNTGKYEPEKTSYLNAFHDIVNKHANLQIPTP